MFSAKNYGLPKDLIEAAKRVHEKQLEENLDKRIKKPKNKYPDFTKLSDALTPAFKKIKKQREEDLKAEEVQFTEEELAEAFAIFLEENYYVDMLTEEDLDYVFEEEFPQWLEEGLLKGVGKGIGYLFGGGKTAKKQDVVKGKSTVPSVPKNEFGFLDDYYLPAGKSMKKMRDRDARKIIRNKASGPWNKVNAATPVKKPQAEEVQFTEEELAEAFAIFLEENFHVEMLTEEDLDYVFENEFPQWLEEDVQKAKDRVEAIKKRLNDVGNAPAIKKIPPNDVGNAPAIKKIPPNDVGNAPVIKKIPTGQHELDAGRPTSTSTAKPEPAPAANAPAKKPARKQVRRSAPKPQSFGALLRKVGGNAPATSDTAAGRAKIKLLDARAKARTAASDAMVRKTGRGQFSWAKKAFNPDGK